MDKVVSQSSETRCHSQKSCSTCGAGRETRPCTYEEQQGSVSLEDIHSERQETSPTATQKRSHAADSIPSAKCVSDNSPWPSVQEDLDHWPADHSLSMCDAKWSLSLAIV